MAKPGPSDSDVYALTPQGNNQLKSEGTSLASEELEILVLVDGAATVAQVAKSASGMSAEEVVAVLGRLLEKKLIAPAGAEPSGLETGFLSINVPDGFFAERDAVEPEAERGVASLQQKGYYVRIARRAAQKRDGKETWHPTVLVIDDDPDLVKLIRTFLRLEGFVVREAARRADIMAAFRQTPTPDLALLDVQLPDANGFEVLARMRQHAALRWMPVIMITAEATREAVRKGLRAGADGYITKPFEPDCVVMAVKQVLGLTGPG